MGPEKDKQVYNINSLEELVDRFRTYALSKNHENQSLIFDLTRELKEIKDEIIQVKKAESLKPLKGRLLKIADKIPLYTQSMGHSNKYEHEGNVEEIAVEPTFQVFRLINDDLERLFKQIDRKIDDLKSPSLRQIALIYRYTDTPIQRLHSQMPKRSPVIMDIKEKIQEADFMTAI